MIGKATHFQAGDRPITACGIVGAEYITDAKGEVDCYRCMRTKDYRRARSEDPTPWCHGCGAMVEWACNCGPLAPTR